MSSPSPALARAPLRTRAVRLGAGLVAVLGLVGLGSLPALPLRAQTPAAGEAALSSLSPSGGLPDKIPLSPGVERDLSQIYEQWIQWQGAFFRDQPDLSEQLVSGLLGNTRQLGLQRLSGLSIGASVRAVEAAERDADFAKATWALDAAERLDPGRPETAFARARIRLSEGRRAAALWSELDGLRRTFSAFPGSSLAGADLALWALFSLLASAGLFVALQMAVKGRLLFADLETMIGRTVSLPSPVLRFLALLLLLWPLLLPTGPLWLLLYWSALLFAHSSLSERVVLSALWALVALSPVAADHVRRRADFALSPAMRGVESLVEGRLHGQLFQDLEQLGTLMPEDPAVIQLMADLHRGLGQWDLALELYRRVVEVEPGNAWALIDIGGYYFFKRDYKNARSYYEEATVQQPNNVVAYYNLSQAFSEDRFLLDDAAAALRRAQEIDAGLVSQLQQETARQRVVTFDGGIARAPEIREKLALRLADPEPDPDLDERARDRAGGSEGSVASPTNGEAPMSGHPTAKAAAPLPFGQVPGALGAALLALLFTQLRPRNVPVGPRSGWTPYRDALVPGLASVREGRGGHAWVGLLIPTALLTLPLIERLAYPLFPIYSATGSALWIVAGVGLIVFFGARIALARLG